MQYYNVGCYRYFCVYFVNLYVIYLIGFIIAASPNYRSSIGIYFLTESLDLKSKVKGQHQRHLHFDESLQMYQMVEETLDKRGALFSVAHPITFQ